MLYITPQSQHYLVFTVSVDFLFVDAYFFHKFS
jgi:hypothetical protein